MTSMDLRLYPLGALATFVLLFSCIVGVFAGKSDSTEYDYRGRREDTKKIGELVKTFRQTTSFALYLPLTIPDDGILYKLRVFLVSTDPVFIQLWRPTGDRRKSFKLINQIKVQTSRVNVTRTFYPVRLDEDGSPQCPVVHEDDRLGIFGTTGQLAIPIYFDQDARSMLAKRPSSSVPLDPGITLQFYDIIFPYGFSVEASVYEDNSRRRSRRATDYRPCPLKRMPNYSTKTHTTSTETKHVTFPMSPNTKPATQTDLIPTAAEDSGTSSAEVLHIAVGSLAGVAVIAIIGVVVLALYCRRRHQQDGLKPVAGGAPASNNPNAAYGVNCDFANEYETPKPEPPESHPYRPVVPPRRAAPEVGNRNSGTYEEINDAGSRRNGKREPAGNGDEHVTGAEADYELYATPVYESLRPEVPKEKPIETSDVVVSDGTNDGPEPEVGRGEERGRQEGYDYLDLVQDANGSAYVL